MVLRKEIECILRAILYPKSNIVLVCKDDGQAQKCMNDFKKLIDKHKIIQLEISEVNGEGYISFKNGSCIKAIQNNNQPNNQPVRGKRFDRFIDNIQDFIIDEEAFESVIKPFMKDMNEGVINIGR